MKKTYNGSCHCQEVKFTCSFELKQPTMCNCSYCHKRNGILHIVDELDVHQGEKELSEKFQQAWGNNGFHSNFKRLCKYWQHHY